MAGVPVGDDVKIITKDEYEQLLSESQFLSCLETVGVDNWEGYEIAIQLSNGDITEDDI